MTEFLDLADDEGLISQEITSRQDELAEHEAYLAEPGEEPAEQEASRRFPALAFIGGGIASAAAGVAIERLCSRRKRRSHRPRFA